MSTFESGGYVCSTVKESERRGGWRDALEERCIGIELDDAEDTDLREE